MKLPRDLAKKGLYFAVILALLAGATFGGYSFYRNSALKHALAEANRHADAGDFRSASLAGQRALQIAPDSAETCRALATTAEKSGSSAELYWRNRLAELEPKDFGNRVKLIGAALRLNALDFASKSFLSLKEPDLGHLGYRRVAAELALRRGQLDVARGHLAFLAGKDPADKKTQFTLAVVFLSSAEAEDREGGLRALQEFKSDPEFKARALSALLDYEQRNARGSLIRLQLSSAQPVAVAGPENLESIKRLATDLSSEFAASMAEQLKGLEALRRLGDTQFETAAAELETQYGKDARSAGDWMLWLSANGMSFRALTWSRTLEEAIRNSPEVSLAAADAMVFQTNWSELDEYLKAREWGPLDYFRSALGAIVAKRLGEADHAGAEWVKIRSKIEKDQVALSRLSQFCVRWDARTEAEDLWWAQAECRGDQSDVLRKLSWVCEQRGDSDGLFRVARLTYQLRPNDPVAMNNYSYLSLMRQRDLDRAHVLAKQVFELATAAPDAPLASAYLSTYIYSLYYQKRYTEALDILSALPEAKLQTPTLAGCYGIVLSAAGQGKKAAEYIRIATAGQRLLPGEELLLKGAG